MDTPAAPPRAIEDDSALPTPPEALVPAAAVSAPDASGSPEGSPAGQSTSEHCDSRVEPPAVGTIAIDPASGSPASLDSTRSSEPSPESPRAEAASTAALERAVASDCPASPSSRLPAPLLILVEYWYARRRCRRLVSLYRRVHAEQPAVAGRALYEEVVVRWTGVERPAARTVLARAAQSFVDWNTDRDLRFRDVVQYLIAQEYMTMRPERHGVVARMGNVIARTVPSNL